MALVAFKFSESLELLRLETPQNLTNMSGHARLIVHLSKSAWLVIFTLHDDSQVRDLPDYKLSI